VISSLIRYNVLCVSSGDLVRSDTWEESEDGEWVLYVDALALERKLAEAQDELRFEKDAAKVDIKTHERYLDQIASELAEARAALAEVAEAFDYGDFAWLRELRDRSTEVNWARVSDWETRHAAALKAAREAK
jgi:hypothetical protein